MLSLPNPPRRGQSLSDANLPETIARIIDYLRAITPRSSPTVRVSTTSSGTTFRAAPQPPTRGGGAAGLSASIYASRAGFLIHCSAGRWTHRYASLAVEEKQFWAGPSGDCPDDAEQIAVGTTYGYLEYDGSAVSWNKGSTYPANATNVLRRCVFHITTASDGDSVSIVDFAARNAGDIWSW